MEEVAVERGMPQDSESESRQAGGRRAVTRELEVASELAQAFLGAARPLEMYRLALGRVTPLVGASFSSVFLRDPSDRDLLKLTCAHNWPQATALYLGQLRIRLGRGPTGRAVAAGEAVEVQDVFADPDLREWWDPARELGFESMISLPLAVRGEVEGALSFYFSAPHTFDAGERRLLRLIADQIAATAEKAHLIEDLGAANAELRRKNQELTRAVEEADSARVLKTEFLANVSHELRTPLTSILGYTYLLQSGSAGGLSPEQRAAAEKIDHSAGILLDLITDLLELSHLKLGRIRAEMKPEDAVLLARRAAAATGAESQRVPFRIEASAEHIPIRTDAAKVIKVLENLLSNAFKFTSSGEVVLTVRVLPAESPAEGVAPTWVEWVVIDTGIGIAAAELPAVFDELRQVDGSSTRLYGGTGMGLALSLRLARLLGGEITVESEAGQGSRFSVRLPAGGADEGDGGDDSMAAKAGSVNDAENPGGAPVSR